ncbi:MAG TPA: GGDEF domain-containing phosphodiesterase, partial [Nocardioidaceae bacterium]|nr:GGDEF domain-containing phosphodiesterase [Nocardioidaceae bacterium]
VSYTENGNDTPKRLLRNADFAMYLAKRAGGGQHRVMDATALLSDSGDVLQRGIESALQRNEFRLAYQPIVTIADSTLHGVEALLRWKDPARGWVMPEVIVPIAERTGLIEELGKWALNTACLELRDWQKNFGAGAVEQMAVNVSAHQLMGSEFVDTVAEVLDRSGVAPGHLLLEITESVLLIDAPRAREVLGELKRLGVRLALDDFGTGYSSLGYLKRFPFDTVKIDREFIADMCADPATRAIVASVIDLAHALDLSVVAEGIETRQQLQQVEDLGADRAQGHYFSVALLTEAFSTTILEASGGPALTSAPIRLPLPATAPNS